MASTDYWLRLFNHADFRRGWHAYVHGLPLEEDASDQYYYGRQTAAETGLQLPKKALTFTVEMGDVVRECDGLVDAVTFRRFWNAMGAYTRQHKIKLANPGEVFEAMRERCVVGQKQIQAIIDELGQVEGDINENR